MKRRTWWIIGGMCLALVLGAGTVVLYKLLTGGSEGWLHAGGPEVTISIGGLAVKGEWIASPDLPEGTPTLAGVFAGRQDNRFFVQETTKGLVVQKGADDHFSVTNTTGDVTEVVVVPETVVYVDVTTDDLDTAHRNGKIYQTVRAGDIDEMGEFSFVRVWGEARGDRLIASTVVYNRPPVISR